MVGGAFSVPKIGGNRSTSDIVIDLKALHEKLVATEQEEDDNEAIKLRRELAPLASGLVEPRWIQHRDKTIRLLVACCLANLLRLYAPEAPFEELVLGRIFRLFLQQLKGLCEPNAIYYSYHFYLLESLTTVKSVVLIWSLEKNSNSSNLDEENEEGRDELLEGYFKVTFDLIHPKVSNTVKVYLEELLETIIDEASAPLPEAVLKLLLNQLENGKEPHLQSFASKIVKVCGERLAPMFGRFFNDIMLDFGAREHDDYGKAMDNIRLLHSQMVSLARSSIPSISNVISQIEEELTLESVELRTCGMGCLAQIFGIEGASVSYPNAWTAWLGRANDRAPNIRGHWIEQAGHLMAKFSNFSKGSQACLQALTDALVKKFLDPDDRLRERVIRVCCQHPQIETLPTDLIMAIGERCRDVKEDVRVIALTFLCDLLENVHLITKDDIDAFISNWSFLPTMIFGLLYTGEKDYRILVEYFFEHSVLAPTTNHAMKWIKIWASLSNDPKSVDAFRSWMKPKAFLLKLGQAFINLASASVNSSDNRMIKVLQHMSERFRSPLVAMSALSSFASHFSKLPQNLQDVWKSLVDPNAPKEGLLEQIEAFQWDSIAAEMKPFIIVFLSKRISWVSVNGTLIADILGLTNVHSSTGQLVEILLETFPVLGKGHVEFLENIIVDSNYSENHLKAFYNFVSSGQAIGNNNDNISADLLSLLKSGSRKQVKYASAILAIWSASISTVDLPQLIEKMVHDTAHPDRALQERSWQALCSIAKHKGVLLAPYLDELYLEFEMLISDPDDSAKLVKVRASKFFGFIGSTLKAIGNEQSDPFVNQFVDLCESKFEDQDGQVNDAMAKSCILLLETLISFDLTRLLSHPSLLKTVASETFYSKIPSFIAGHKVSVLFILPVLSALPSIASNSTKERLANMIRNSLSLWQKNQRPIESQDSSQHLVNSSSISSVYELVVPLMIFLAFSFGSDSIDKLEQLSDIKSVLITFIEMVGDINGLSYLFSLSVEIKRYRIVKLNNEDVVSRNLYLIAEIAQQLIRTRTNQLNASLQVFPLPLSLHDRCLASLGELGAKNVAKSYLGRLQDRAKAQKEEAVEKKQRKLQFGTIKKEKAVKSASSSPQRRNPDRATRLPAGCLGAMADESEEDVDEEMVKDENLGSSENVFESFKQKGDHHPSKKRSFVPVSDLNDEFAIEL